jgi:hypothetical protein
MLVLVWILPAAIVLASMGLSRVVPTRLLAFAGAAALAIAALVLFLSRPVEQPIQLLDTVWFELSEEPLRLSLVLNTLGWPVALLALGGGALGMLGIAMAFPPDLRGFGGLPAALATTTLAILVGITSAEMLLLPTAWVFVTLAAAATLRSSGSLPDLDSPLIVGLAGISASILVLAWAILGGLPGEAQLSLTVAIMLGLGVVPFNGASGALSEAPAGIGGTLLAIGIPLLAGHTLIRGAQMGFSPTWSMVLTLLGVLTLVACAVGALGATRARRRIAWQHGSQQGLVVVAAAQGSSVVPAQALLLTAALSTLVAAFALAQLERRTGTDDLGEAQLPAPLILPGAALIIAGLAAVGAPGTWGFWARVDLLGALEPDMIWFVGPMLLGSALLGVSYLAPVAALWRGTKRGAEAPPQSRDFTQFLPWLAAIPLLGLAIVAAFSRGGNAIALTIGAILGILSLPLLLSWFPARVPTDETEQTAGAALTPALDESVSGIAWLAAPAALLNGAWSILLYLSELLSRLLMRFEGRYYMAGLMVSLIIMVLLFI